MERSKSSFGKRALLFVQQQAEALSTTAERLRAASLGSAVEILLSCGGKVVVSGSGKSGIAARKIAGTLTSTGTVAIFLHPVDALHGDLGLLSEEDVVILISKSGESPEMVDLLGHLKLRKVSIIAIVGNTDSTVAQGADAVLDGSILEEAGPYHLAPTTSTTIAMVLGDAISMTLMEAKGFSVEDFALNHPGGTLGKRLTVRVRDLMHGGDSNPVVDPGARWEELVEAVTRGGLGAVSVVNADGTLAGIVTDGDLRRAIPDSLSPDTDPPTTAEVMTADPVTVSPETLAIDALLIMEERPSQIAVLPVVSEAGKCEGLLRIHDLVRAGLR